MDQWIQRLFKDDVRQLRAYPVAYVFSVLVAVVATMLLANTSWLDVLVYSPVFSKLTTSSPGWTELLHWTIPAICCSVADAIFMGRYTRMRDKHRRQAERPSDLR